MTRSSILEFQGFSFIEAVVSLVNSGSFMELLDSYFVFGSFSDEFQISEGDVLKLDCVLPNLV